MKKNLPDRYFYPAVFIYEDGQEIAVDFPTSVSPPAVRPRTTPCFPPASCLAA